MKEYDCFCNYDAQEARGKLAVIDFNHASITCATSKSTPSSKIVKEMESKSGWKDNPYNLMDKYSCVRDIFSEEIKNEDLIILLSQFDTPIGHYQIKENSVKGIIIDVVSSFETYSFSHISKHALVMQEKQEFLLLALKMQQSI